MDELLNIHDLSESEPFIEGESINVVEQDCIDKLEEVKEAFISQT